MSTINRTTHTMIIKRIYHHLLPRRKNIQSDSHPPLILLFLSAHLIIKRFFLPISLVSRHPVIQEPFKHSFISFHHHYHPHHHRLHHLKASSGGVDDDDSWWWAHTTPKHQSLSSTQNNHDEAPHHQLFIKIHTIIICRIVKMRM